MGGGRRDLGAGPRVPAHGVGHVVLFSSLSPEAPGNWFPPYVTAHLHTQLPTLTAAHLHKPQPPLRLPENQEVRPHK